MRIILLLVLGFNFTIYDIKAQDIDYENDYTLAIISGSKVNGKEKLKELDELKTIFDSKPEVVCFYVNRPYDRSSWDGGKKMVGMKAADRLNMRNQKIAISQYLQLKKILIEHASFNYRFVELDERTENNDCQYFIEFHKNTEWSRVSEFSSVGTNVGILTEYEVYINNSETPDNKMLFFKPKSFYSKQLKKCILRLNKIIEEV